MEDEYALNPGKYWLQKLMHSEYSYADYDLESRVNLLPGEKRWIASKGRVFTDSEGRPTRMIGIDADITDYKRALQALQASEEMYRSLMEQAAEGILLCSMDGAILAANAQFCQMMGYSQEDLLGRKCTDLISEDESVRDPLHFKDLECGKSFVTALVLRHRDGRKIPVEISGKAFRQERVQAMIRDISGRKMAEEALLRYSELLEDLVAERTEQLQKAERLAVIGETAAMIGHDLRNPLQVMTCMLFLAKEQLNTGNLLPPQGQPSLEEILRTMEESADYMEKIISDMQDYARPMKMELVETDLEALGKETLASINVSSGVTVSLEAEPSMPPLALSPQKLKRIIINLVNNAVQAMPNGGHITISILCQEGWAKLAVKDTGAGISEEVLPRIFQPLFTTRAGGMGLGLVVCKRLVEAMGGRITIKSKAGSGTDVIIRIPARREDED
ncbi:Methyl sulfide methyltransferase-associated sensor [uncultured archaeon]|nr:Methyl sulfide methyltransferase-associated sensor [uncultured archaeon]